MAWEPKHFNENNLFQHQLYRQDDLSARPSSNEHKASRQTDQPCRRGDEKNKMCAEIYGTAFTKKADLKSTSTHDGESWKNSDHENSEKSSACFMNSEDGPGSRSASIRRYRKVHLIDSHHVDHTASQ